jgi:hypothetical protein
MTSNSPNSTVRVRVQQNNGRSTIPEHHQNNKPSTKNHQVHPQPAPVLQQPRGSLVCTLLPALDKLSRTRHGSADLNGIGAALKRAEQASPGFCDHFVAELITILTFPRATNSEIRSAIDRLTTGKNPNSRD